MMHPRTRVLLLGIIFHVIYMGSIFDIYFRSPLVQGVDLVHPPSPAPASRLLLAVADGLRADKLFEDKLKRAPFLQSKVLKEGRWGVCHTRVPTESRPGHVALIAGFYEDVSAVTTGWTTNPVNFDSVFNQSRHTWSYGSPDILPMFSIGASDPNRVETFMYGAEEEDFSKDDSSNLDTWVFDRFEKLFKQAESNATLNDMLHQDKIVFFLHLLGLDTNGHAHRPYSQQYLNNIRVVDDGLRRMQAMLDTFYGNDGKTSFILAADHGMSNRGSHGDGDPQNTETPLIAWGAGIKRPDMTNPSGHDHQSIAWQLKTIQRNDVAQADVAPLMSSLIGVAYPMNSVGVLPLEYLDNTEEYKANAIFKNAQGLLNQFLVKANRKGETELLFQPFKPLLDYKQRVETIGNDIQKGKFKMAEEQSLKLMELLLEGLRYYQTYDWLLLRSIVSMGYLGWIAYSTLFIIKTYAALKKSNTQQSHLLLNTIATIFYGGLCTVLYYKDSPLSYYLYAIFPIIFWTNAIQESYLIPHIISSATSASSARSVALYTISYLVSLEVLVVSYFYRELLTACLLLMGFLWPLFMPLGFRERHYSILRAWRALCFITSIFTLLPVELEENVLLIVAGGILIVLSGVLAVILIPRYIQAALPTSMSKPAAMIDISIVWTQIGIILASIVVVCHTSWSLNNKRGLPFLNAVTSWIILATCIAIPVIDRFSKSEHYLKRLVIVYLSFAPVFILLSVSFETLFYFFYSMVVFFWMLVEQQLYFYENKVFNGKTYWDTPKDASTNNYRILKPADMRVASFFLFFINIAFFGTGNMASISSFTIESVYRFTTVFDPFLMGALLIFKILIPFFLLSSALSLLSRCLELPPFALFLLVLSTTDVMTLNFFFLVRDSGSWLEIGTTISHFCIASAFIVFQILLFSMSHLLVGGVLIPQKKGGGSKIE